MQIIGSGMMANAFMNDERFFPPSVCVFASGVSNSLCNVQTEFDREVFLLKSVIEECKSNQSIFVYFSSAGAVYKKSNDIKGEDFPILPESFYGRHKVLCESIVVNSGVCYIVVRLPNVVGYTKNKNQLIPHLANSVMSGHVRVFRDAWRDIISVDDVVKILLGITKAGVLNLTINMASGYSVPVVDIVNEIQQCLALSPEIEMLDGGDRQIFDISLMTRVFPEALPFDGEYYKKLIEDYCDFFKKHR